MKDDVTTRLTAAGAEYQAIKTSLDTARRQLHPLVIEALQADVPQKTVAALSGYTRERIRTLAREHGIEAK